MKIVGFRFVLVFLLGMALVGCNQTSEADPLQSTPEATDSADSRTGNSPNQTRGTSESPEAGRAQLVLAGGCFWCMEVAFEQLKGVSDVVSGYAGGTKETADYRTVSAGVSRHAEAIRITYDPSVISEDQLLEVFFRAAHDPTQINRQYPDVGRQYRSAIFYATVAQKESAQEFIQRLNQSGEFTKKIATTLEPLDGFYVAEDYHQDYVKHHPEEPYVVAHSLPKAEKVRKKFPELIRK